MPIIGQALGFLGVGHKNTQLPQTFNGCQTTHTQSVRRDEYSTYTFTLLQANIRNFSTYEGMLWVQIGCTVDKAKVELFNSPGPARKTASHFI